MSIEEFGKLNCEYERSLVIWQSISIAVRNQTVLDKKLDTILQKLTELLQQKPQNIRQS